jgi:hypothetical protein
MDRSWEFFSSPGVLNPSFEKQADQILRRLLNRRRRSQSMLFKKLPAVDIPSAF